MPNPKMDEKRKDFVNRCVPMVMKEGTANDNKQAVAMCNSMFDEARKSFELPELTAVKMLKMMDADMDEYARSESWDIIDACNALIQMANISRAEIHEGDISKVTSIMRQIAEFIGGEIMELEESALQSQQEEAQEEMGGEMDMMKSFSNISMIDTYAKSLVSTIAQKDLAIKYVAKNEIKGYTFLWGGPTLTDVEIEYFTKSTDFWDDRLAGMKSRPLTWDHAQDKSFKGSPVIGEIVDFGDDEIGRWFVAKLDQSHRYKHAIDELIKRGVLGASSDSAPQYTQRVKTGKSTWIKQWPWFASALTNVPAEPRTIDSLEFLKSLGIQLLEAPDLRAQYEYKKRQAEVLKIKSER